MNLPNVVMGFGLRCSEFATALIYTTLQAFNNWRGKKKKKKLFVRNKAEMLHIKLEFCYSPGDTCVSVLGNTLGTIKRKMLQKDR